MQSLLKLAPWVVKIDLQVI